MHIEEGVSIAVFGLNGYLGKSVVESLLSVPFICKIQTPIRLVTSSTRRPIESRKVKYYNLHNTTFEEAFAGVDVVINLGNVPHSPLQDILHAVITNKVKLYIPSQFGLDLQAAQRRFPGFLSIKSDHSEMARMGGIKTVDVYTSLFINDHDQNFYSRPFPQLNFDPKTNTIEIPGDENLLINPTFQSDIGKAVSAIATFHDLQALPDHIRIYSDRVSISDTIAHYEHRTGKKMKLVYSNPKEELYQIEQKQSKKLQVRDIRLFLWVFMTMGESNGMVWEYDHHRELINPGESIFKWTRYRI